MNRKTLDELLSGHALGALEPDEQRQLEILLSHDSEARAQAAALIDTAAAIAAAASPRVTPSAAQRARILAAVEATPQKQRAPTEAPLAPGFTLLARSDDGWVETDTPGFRTKLLSTGPQPGYELRLVLLDPGTTISAHEHAGIEEIYMISGHFQTEGQLLGPGDFLRSEMGTHHHDSYSPDGCLALLLLRPALAA